MLFCKKINQCRCSI